jgi:exonuclease SbcC
MGLPVKLHIGDELEVLVQDRNSPESPASELGGGYANLIGIAFRIALQKMILPRVHVIVLDEPSTHVDQANMELLIPFFDRLKENLSTYGIQQLILIDHHPDWKESKVGLIPVGADPDRCARQKAGEAFAQIGNLRKAEE